MRSLKIERTAVNYVQKYFNQSDVLEDYIAQNDREPIWDGDIMIKWENGETTKVYTQVKGKTVKLLPKKPTYPISIINLKNYKNDGGIAYFVVFIIGNDCYLYYALLTPMKLQRLIEMASGQGQTSITLNSILTKDLSDFETEFKTFDINCKRQTSYAGLKPMSLEEALKKGHMINIPLANCSNEQKAIEYLINNPTWLYAEIDCGDYKSFYPIGYDSFKLIPIQEIQEPISVGDTVYFDKYTKQYKKDIVTICIEECMDFTIQKQAGKITGKLNFHRSSKCVFNIVKELKFIQSATQMHHFKIGNVVINFNYNDSNTKSLDKELQYWLRIKQLFETLHISLDLDISGFSNEDYRKLDLLMAAILDKKEISQSHELGQITTADIGNYTILLFAEKQKNGNYLIDDFFTSAKKMAFAYADKSKEQKLATSMFSLVINHEDFASFINVNYNILVSTYDEMKKFNPYLTDRANNDMLILLNTYDKQGKKPEMLKAAYEINNWIIKTNDKNHALNTINKLQIIKRNSPLSDENLDALLELSNDRELGNDIKTAIQLLLENQPLAEYYFKRLNKIQQKFFQSLPIYIFWKNHN